MAELRRRKAEGSRGAAMLEFALVVSLLFMLVSAVIDFGLGWRKSLEVSSTLRGGARVISSLGASRSADAEALATVNAGIREIGAANVLRVIVYKATAANGTVPATCRALTPSASGTGINDVCNVYGPAQLAALSSSSARFSGSTTSCQSDDWDRWYCPVNDRENRQAVGSDYVGVFMEYRTEWVIGIVPGDGQLRTDQAIMRIEPG